MTGQRPAVASCRSCWAPIIWATTEAGKRIPVDVEPVEGGTIELSSGRKPIATVVSRKGREPGRKLHRAHFASCSSAGQHRKPVPPSGVPSATLFSEVER